MQNIYTLGSDKWRRWISTNIANNSVNIESAQSTANQLASDLNTEVENRISSDKNIQNQIDVIGSGQLGSIKPTDAAPTPARNGQYVFSIGGNKPAWLTAEAGVTTVKAGDGVAVVYTAPSSYSYTHVDSYTEIEQVRSQSTSKMPSSKLVDDELKKVVNTSYMQDQLKDYHAASTSVVRNMFSNVGEVGRDPKLYFFVPAGVSCVDEIADDTSPVPNMTHITRYSTNADYVSGDFKLDIPWAGASYTWGFWINVADWTTILSNVSNIGLYIYDGTAWVNFFILTDDIGVVNKGNVYTAVGFRGTSAKVSIIDAFGDWRFLNISVVDNPSASAMLKLVMANPTINKSIRFQNISFIANNGTVKLHPQDIIYKNKDNDILAFGRTTKSGLTSEVQQLLGLNLGGVGRTTETIKANADRITLVQKTASKQRIAVDELVNEFLNCDELGYTTSFLVGATSSVVENTSDVPLAKSYLSKKIKTTWESSLPGEFKLSILRNNSTSFTMGFWIDKASWLQSNNASFDCYSGTVWMNQSISQLEYGFIRTFDFGSSKYLNVEVLSQVGDWIYLYFSTDNYQVVFSSIMVRFDNTIAANSTGIDIANFTFIRDKVVPLDPFIIYRKNSNSLPFFKNTKTEDKFLKTVIDYIADSNQGSKVLFDIDYELLNKIPNCADSTFPLYFFSDALSIVETPADFPIPKLSLPSIYKVTGSGIGDKKIEIQTTVFGAGNVTISFWMRLSEIANEGRTYFEIYSGSAWDIITIPKVVGTKTTQTTHGGTTLKNTFQVGDWTMFQIQCINITYSRFMLRYAIASTKIFHFANVTICSEIRDISPFRVYNQESSTSYNTRISNLEISSLFSGNILTGEEFYMLGDSLFTNGVIAEVMRSLSNSIYDNSKNTDRQYPLSIGGTAITSNSKQCLQWRARNLVSQHPTAKRIFLESANSNVSGALSDAPFMLSQVYELSSLGFTSSTQAADYWTANFAAIVTNYSIEKGVCINIPFNAAGKKVHINSLPTSNGIVTLILNGYYYAIAVTTDDTMADIIYKMLEYQYFQCIDSAGLDGESINIAGWLNTLTYVDTDSTGMSVTISDTSEALLYYGRFFKGEANSTDWNNYSKWGGEPSFYAGYKGVIEYLQANFHEALIYIFSPTLYSFDPTLYVKADGTPDVDAFRLSEDYLKGYNMGQAQKAICGYYGLQHLDIMNNCNITLFNFDTYYYPNNVHPKTEGYIRWGETAFRLL